MRVNVNTGSNANHDADGMFARGNGYGGARGGIKRPRGVKSLALLLPSGEWRGYSLARTSFGVAVLVRSSKRACVLGEFTAVAEVRWMVRELRAAGFRRLHTSRANARKE